MAKRPTTQAYDELQRAFDHFNKHLFGGELAQCLITMQRKDVRVYGYYSPRRFGSNRQRGKTVDEIALNPIHFSHKDLGELMQTLVHEMCHMWQEHHGTPSRQGYHNREFADKMLEVGLHPSDTGKPGGKMVGQSMADYPVKGGPFEKALKRLTSRKFKVSFYDRIAELLMEPVPMLTPAAKPAGLPKPAKPASQAITTPTRAKFQCPTCRANAWGKPTLKLICGDDMDTMVIV